MEILSIIYLLLTIISFNSNIFVIYCIFITKNKLNSGDIYILSLCLNNILFVISFILQLFISFCTIQTFIIEITLSLYPVIYFLIADRSYKKVVLHYDIKFDKALKNVIIITIVYFIIFFGFGMASTIKSYGSYCMFEFVSPIMIGTILMMTLLFCVVYGTYLELYKTNVNSQNTVKKMMSPRRQEEKKGKELTIRPTNEIINRKVAKKVISYVCIFFLLWISTIIIFIYELISLNNQYVYDLWIICIILNSLLSGVVYGLTNNKVREYFSREPGKIRILINRLTEKKIKLNNEVKEIKEEIVPSTPRVDSACGIHIVDMRGSEVSEYKSSEISFSNNLTINPEISPASSNESTPSPKNRIMSFKNIEHVIIAREKYREEQKEKKSISPNVTHSPTDLRNLRLKNLMKEEFIRKNNLDIPHRTITVGLPGIVE